MCQEWRDSFSAFMQYMGPKPMRTSLERKNVNGNYEPGNCRWATPIEQSNNTRFNRAIEINGERLTITTIAEKIGFTRDKVRGIYDRHGLKGLKKLCELSL